VHHIPSAPSAPRRSGVLVVVTKDKAGGGGEVGKQLQNVILF